MERFGLEGSSEGSVVGNPGRTDLATATASREEPPQEHDERSGEREALLADVQRLEAELERYRAHAERTSKLFLAATNYAEWVRESARRDAELALRKARARVGKLEATARELERSESELVRLHGEIAKLQALTDETRARLSAFLAAGLQALNTGVEPALQEESPAAAVDDLQETLHEQASTSVPLGESKTRER